MVKWTLKPSLVSLGFWEMIALCFSRTSVEQFNLSVTVKASGSL